MKVFVFKIRSPMKVAFGHAKAVRKDAESIFILIEHEGINGIGEAAPRDYVTGENIDSVFNACSVLDLKTISADINLNNLQAACDYLQRFELQKRITSAGTYCALEMALWDLLGKKFNKPISELLVKTFCNGNPIQKATEFKTSQVFDLTLSIDDFLQKYKHFHYLKVKVTNDQQQNIARVQTIRQQLGYELPIIVDANMAWTLDGAIHQMKALEPYNIDYYEEPLCKGDFDGYAKLREKTSAKILLDESLCTFNDAQVALQKKSCDAFNIRISKCGGLSQALRLIKFARENNICFQIGAQVAEVGPLIAAGRHLREIADDSITFEAGQPDFFFDDYVVTPMPSIDRAKNVALPIHGCGLGVEPNTNIKNYIYQSAFWDGHHWFYANQEGVRSERQ